MAHNRCKWVDHMSIENSLRRFLKNYKWIKSSYIYGGYMRNKNNYNDIDLLIVYKEGTQIRALSAFSVKVKKSIDPDVSLTTISSGEARFFIHQAFSPFYYFNVYKNSKFLTGKDIFKEGVPATGLLDAYKRIAYITQRARNDLVDGAQRDAKYINFKLVRWIPYAVQEVLYLLYGEYVERDRALDRFTSLNPSFKKLKPEDSLMNKVLFLDQLENFISKKLTLNPDNDGES